MFRDDILKIPENERIDYIASIDSFYILLDKNTIIDENMAFVSPSKDDLSQNNFLALPLIRKMFHNEKQHSCIFIFSTYSAAILFAHMYSDSLVCEDIPAVGIVHGSDLLDFYQRAGYYDKNLDYIVFDNLLFFELLFSNNPQATQPYTPLVFDGYLLDKMTHPDNWNVSEKEMHDSVCAYESIYFVSMVKNCVFPTIDGEIAVNQYLEQLFHHAETLYFVGMQNGDEVRICSFNFANMESAFTFVSKKTAMLYKMMCEEEFEIPIKNLVVFAVHKENMKPYFDEWERSGFFGVSVNELDVNMLVPIAFGSYNDVKRKIKFLHILGAHYKEP